MKKALFLLFLLASVTAFGQLDNRAFEQRMAVEPADSNKLFLGLNVSGFMKNNEFFGTVIEGYTLFGYQLNPYLSYHISENVRLDAGVYAQKDFGNDAYSDVKPTFSLKIRQNNFNFIFGTLEGSVSHRLIEPLYDFERVLNNRLENGAQMLWMKDDLFFDVWIDWQKMIYANSTEPEMFKAGISFNKTVFRSGNFHVDLPVQAIAAHQGGQIDIVDNEVITSYNAAVGLTLESQATGFIQAFGVKAYGVGFTTNATYAPFKSGTGLFFNPYVKSNIGLTVMGSYWRGAEYLPLEGSGLYSSSTAPTIMDDVREMIMLRFLYDVKVADGFTLTARAEPFYDTYSSEIEYSFGLYLNFTERFFLLNAKKNR